MRMKKHDHLELLEWIDPASLSYQEWVNVGMALKHEGYSASDWDSWSRSDSRYKQGECEKKWESFSESTDGIVTGGTIFSLARENGWNPSKSQHGHELEFDDEIGTAIIDSESIGSLEINEPGDGWNPAAEITAYLSALFDSSDYVGYVTESTRNEKGKYIPANAGSYDRTAGQLIAELQRYDGDIESVFGSYDKNGGAWIRFNPLNGKGVRNTDVEELRYALVESDSLDIGKQLSIIRQLELPVAAVVYSGSKSVHAIVKVEASSQKEYRERVDYLYQVCDKNGLETDRQNRNAARLSRFPGFIRGEHKQFLIATNEGKESWNEWVEYIESVNDNLPDPESLADTFFSPPKLADPLIDGILRKGHKMLISGPSKSGKSFALIELCIAIAEGMKWLGHQCAKGRVMYVNLELDRASCINRFREVYDALGIAPENIGSIMIWNLRGTAPSLDKLVPKLIRRCDKMDYAAIVIDPIYKVITGDENSASDMAQFVNQFDKIANALGSSIIYAHHHSKGAQGSKKSMDRASGSGVFARDPDALLDIIELPIPGETMKKFVSNAKAAAIRGKLDTIVPNWRTYLIERMECDENDADALMNYASEMLEPSQIDAVYSSSYEAEVMERRMTALRISGTLREFPSFDPIDVFFRYPVHILDTSGIMAKIKPEGDIQKRGIDVMRDAKKKEIELNIEAFINAFNELQSDGCVTVKELAESGLIPGKSESAIRAMLNRWTKAGKIDGFKYAKGTVTKTE